MELSKRVLGVQASVTLAISAKAKRLKAQGEDVIGLGAGEPDYDTPQNIKEAAKRAIDEGFTKYTPSSGMPSLREAIARKFKEENGIEYDPSQVLVSNGAKQVLMEVCLSLLQEGDEVILVKPYWLSYEEQVRMCGATPVFAQADGLEVKADLIAKKVTSKTRMLIINSPCNPSGKVIPREELERIAALCVEHDLICVSDEPYERILFDGQEHVSIASLGKGIYERTITVNAVSKTYSMTGWRIGYCAGPKKVIEAMNDLQSHASSAPCSISQKAALEAITGPQDSVEMMRASFEKRRDYVVGRLNRMRGVSCSLPEGTFYAFPDISGTGLSSLELCERLLDEELLALVPGEPFGSGSHVRISFAAGMDQLEEGLDRLERFCERIGGAP